MTAKEMKLALPRLDAEVRRLQASRTRLISLRKSILRECPAQYLTDATPLLNALQNGKQQGQSVMDFELRRHLRPLLEQIDSWDGMGISQIETHIETLQERREMILESLPSNEEITEATQKLDTMKRELREKRDHYNANWQAYIAALESAVGAARAAVDSKPSPKLAHNINALVDDFALGGYEPTKEEVDRDEITLAIALTHLLVQVSSAQAIDPLVDKEVRSALAKRVKQAA